MSCARAPTMKRWSGRSAPRSGASPGAMVWLKASGKPCAGCPRSAAEFRQLLLWRRGLGRIRRHSTSNPEIRHPDDITRIRRCIMIDDEEDVDRDSFRRAQGEGVARLERPQTAVDARFDEERRFAADVFREFAAELIG